MTNKHMAAALVKDQRDFAKKQALRTLKREIVNAAIRVGVEPDVANTWMDLPEDEFMDTIVLELGEEKCGEVLAIVKHQERVTKVVKQETERGIAKGLMTPRRMHTTDEPDG